MVCASSDENEEVHWLRGDLTQQENIKSHLHSPTAKITKNEVKN